jgi:hypothetical protein
MNRHNPGRAAAGPAALAVAGVLIAGCSSSPSTTSSAGSGGSQAAASTTAGGSSGGQGSGTTTVAGSPLFPIAVGERWVYADHLGGPGSSTVTNTIKAVKPVSGGDLVTMADASTITGASAKPTKVTYLFHSDGSISVPFTQFSGARVTISSGSIVWPPAAAIASGQSRTSVLSISVKTSGQVIHEKVHVTVKGAGTASVTVPAGTYQATVIDQTQAETIFGHHIDFEIRTWLAPNVGPVKSEVLSKSAFGGGPEVVEELKSFTK